MGDFSGLLTGFHIRWNGIALLTNWSLQLADNVYVGRLRKNSFTYVENDDGSAVRCPTDVELAGLRYQLEASRDSSLAEEL